MNPYASFLDGRDPVEVIAETPRRLRTLLDSIGSKANQTPAPGKWSAREILCHLADTEIVFAFRIRQALAEPHHVIQPFDQDRWADQYSGYEADAALDLFTAVRQWNRSLLARTAGANAAKPLSHPERGTMTFSVLVETMGGHDLNHIRQMEALAGLL